MHFYPKIVYVTCTICQIPFVCTQWESTIYKPWTPGVPPHQQPLYQPVKDFPYCRMLGPFNNWDILQFSYKATYSEDILKIIKLYYTASVTIWLHWFKNFNMVPLIQHIQKQRATVLSNYCQNPVHYKKILWWKNQYIWVTSCKIVVHGLYTRQQKVVLVQITTIEQYHFSNMHTFTYVSVCNISNWSETNT